MPLLSGVGAGDQAAALFAQFMRKPHMMTQLAEATFVGERRWDVKFKGGVTVKLPESGVGNALATLEDLERTRHVMTLDEGMVDLRLEDRITLRIPENFEKGPVL